MAVQGIELPVSLQIKNLQDITNQLKKFANGNILSESLGGKKIEQELNKILDRLDQVQAKSKIAFTTQSNFTSVEKDVNQIELGLNRIKQDISNLTFKDLKIPDDVQGQIDALQSRIRELNNSLLTFKGTQKDKLINNQSFMANLKVAEPTQAAKMLEKGYDELYKAIDKGMNKVNTTLALKAAAYKEQQEVITQNSAGKAAMTQWGALGFIQEAFKSLPKDNSKKSEVQKLMESVMNYTAGDGKTGGEFDTFKRGAIGQSSFLKLIQSQFQFTPEQMNEIRSRLSQQAKELEVSATEVLKRMGTDDVLAKNVLFGSKADLVNSLKEQYEEQQSVLKKLEAEYSSEQTRANAYTQVKDAFIGPNQAIVNKAREIEEALKAPSATLQQYQQTLMDTVTKNPMLSESFGSAAQNINTLLGTIDAGKAKLQQMDQTINKMQGISNFISRYIGVYAIVRKVGQAVRSALNNIKELDKSITNIAVVTNMSQADLWGKIGEYTAMAQQFGVATKDVYTVSQLFYQQGLQTNQVMSLTTETLKMAKISGMGYEQAANAMTVAIRAFRIEMSDAQQVTDTYSALAAKFAVSSAEIANAMEKTASSAANVGMSLQSTSAFMSVMIQTTRESAQNIGSALKSIISRYGEMKASPSTLLNVDGEEVAFNKVDTALQSVGISIKDAAGQFRDFDDVIIELAQKWNSLDNNTQRYIATVMAGNRQQSRFIALVSNYDELNRAMNVASSAENASIVQVAKTMDSLESKTNQLKNAFSQLYLDLHLEEGLKGAYDVLTRIVSTIGKLGMLKGVIPTLMTVVNAGFGAKSLIGMGIESYKQRRNNLQQEVDANTDKAKNKIDDLIKSVETQREMPVRTKVDTTELDLAIAKTTMLDQKSTVAQTTSMLKQANPALTSSTVYGKLQDGLAFNKLATPEGRAEVLQSMNINKTNTSNYTEIDNALARLGGAITTTATQVESAGSSIATSAGVVSTAQQGAATAAEGAATAAEGAAVAAEGAAQADEVKAQAGQVAAQSDQVEANISEQVAQAKQVEATASHEAASADEAEAASSRLAAQLAGMQGSKLSEAQWSQRISDILVSGKFDSNNVILKALLSGDTGLKAGASTRAVAREIMKTGQQGQVVPAQEPKQQQPVKPAAVPAAPPAPPSKPSTSEFSGQEEKNKWYSKFFQKDAETGKTKFSSTGVTAIGIASGITRMIAPMITALGASIKDKGTDTIEGSKFITGIGNGLSGAAMGAQIGMAAGPWGAAIGAIGGFLINGLSAIIDGANYTLAERIANLKQEAKEASDESLKKQAKVIDLSSTLDNLQNLRKAMYNSSEDMKAYQDAISSAADSYPELVSAYDSAGNAIVDLTTAEAALSQARLEGARAAKVAAVKELGVSDTTLELYGQQQTDEQFKILRDYVALRSSNPTKVEGIQIAREEGLLPDELSNNAFLRANSGSLSSIFNPDGEWHEGIPGDIGIAVDQLSKWVKKHKDIIGTDNLFELAGVNENANEYDFKDVRKIYESIAAIFNKEEKRNDLLKDQANAAISLESFLSSINYDKQLSSEQVSQLETTKNYQALFNNALLQVKPEEYNDLNEWQEKGTNFGEKSTEIYQQFKAWYNSLSTNFKDAFAQLDYNEYINPDEIIQDFNVTGTGLETSLIEQFVEATTANRDRILKAVYQYDNDGNNTGALNEDLSGIRKINRKNSTQQIANLFDIQLNEDGSIDKSAEIISKYSDYFTDQIVSINKLADQGYTALASNRFEALSNLATALSDIDNSTTQNDLFGTITSIDLSSFASISSAYESIQKYGKENNKTAEVQSLLDKLTEAQNNLIFNVNTVIQELTATITNSAKDMDEILSTNKAGISLDKAIEAFNKLDAQFDEVDSFDDIFAFDAALGKYVYTQNGLQQAIAAKEQNLADTVTQLSESAKVYTEKIATKNEDGSYSAKRAIHISDDFWQKNNAETISKRLISNLQLGNEDASVLNAYQDLVDGYLDATQAADRNNDGFIKYLENRAQQVSEQADAANVLLEQYRLNKKNQYYQAIDWNKLVTGTDYTKTNEELTKSLAKEVGLYYEEIDRFTGKATGKWLWKTKDGLEASWEDIQNAYLDKTYGTDEEIAGDAEKMAAKAAAKAAIKGQQLQAKNTQLTTAISELLEGQGKVLSETSIALLQGREDITLNEQGAIIGGTNFIATAVELYKTYAKSTATLSEKNSVYTNILTKQFEQSNQLITALSAGASMDLTTLSDTFTKFGLELSQYYDATAENIEDIWKGNEEKGIFGTFSGALETDIFGKTVIKDWDKFVTGLSSKIDLSQYTDTFEYQNAYSTYVDGLINLDTQLMNLIKGQYDAAFASITQFKQLNVSQLNLEDRLQLAGGGAVAADDLQLLNNGILKIDNTVQYAHNAIKLFSNLSTLNEEELYKRTGWTGADLAKNWRAAQTILTESYTAWSNISENLTALTDDNVSALMEKGGLNLLELNTVFTKIGDNYVMRLDKYRDMLIKQFTGKTGEAGEKALSPAQLKKVNDSMAKATNTIANQLTGIDWEKILDGTATELDWTNFQNTMAASLKSLGLNLSDYYTWADGKTTLNLTKLRADIATTNSEIGKAFNKQLNTTIATLQQNALSGISNALEMSSSATFDMSQMQEFMQQFNEITGQNIIDLDQLFTYNEGLGGYTLNLNRLNEYKNAQKSFLEGLGMNSAAIDEYIEDQTNALIRSNLDINDFINGGYQTPTSESTQQLVAQLRILSEKTGEAADDWVEQQLQTLLQGGEAAVNVLKNLKGESNVSADEIASVYAAATNRLKISLDLMASEAGTIVDSYTAAIFVQAGASVDDLGNGQAVITSIPNEGWGKKIAAAYMALYNSLKTSAGATVSDLNNAYAKILESAEVSQSNPIEALQNAASMTYTALGEILAKEGIKLEDVMADQARYGIQNLGVGKIQIIDFTKFASEMGWDTNTEEYVTAFKAYNDALIELNHKAEKNIIEEVKGLGEAKAGDQINLTTLWTKIQQSINTKLESENWEDYIPQAKKFSGGIATTEVAHSLANAAKQRNNALKNAITSELELYGATFNNGILTINANANIQGIMSTIARIASENANLLPDQLAELADAVREFIEGIVNAIKNGISGNLKNTEAQALQTWATAQDLGKLDFTQTADGLQLSTQSATQLYNKLKEIDALQASLVFDELNDSLKETNENYASVTSIMARIKELDTLIADEKISDARKNQYKEELELAKEILAVRSTSEDDSFNFMSNEIPSAQNNPLNYFRNLSQAFQSFRDAFDIKKGGKSGFMDYTDWYNIVTEFNNIAGATGTEIQLGAHTLTGKLTDAANAIQAGASALTTVDTGELKVNLTDVGIGIKSGADALEGGITEGVQSIARAQAKSLDGLIAMLELIVSMEQLGDIDVEGNGIDLTDLFTVKMPDGSTEINWNQYTPVYEAWRQDMITKFQDYLDKGGADGTSEYIDLGRALEGIKIGNLDLIKIIKMEPKDLKNADKAVQQVYTAVLAAFSEAAKSGNYDLNNISQSVMQVLTESGLTDTIQLDIGGVTYYISGSTMTVVDWESADTQEVLKALAAEKTKSDEEARTTLSNWITAYGNGTLTGTTELKYVLAVKKNVTLDEKSQITSVTVGGKTYTNAADFNNAMYAQALVDAGVDFDTDAKIKAASAEGAKEIPVDVPMKKHTDVRVISGEEGIQWWDGDKGPYATKQEMLDKAWEDYDQRQQAAGVSGKTKEEYLYEEWGIRESVTAKVTLGETTVDITNDASARAAIKQEIERSVKEDTVYELNSTGNLEIELPNGMKVTLSGEAVVGADGMTVDNTKVAAELQKILGLDSGLVDNITTAITQAFQDKSVSEAVSKAITNGLTGAVSGEENTVEVPIPSLTLKPSELKVDTTGLTPETEGDAGGIQIDGLTAEVSSYTESPEADKTALAQDIAALITSYSESPTGVNTSALAQDISGLITSYSESTNGVDKTKLAQDIAALITSYTDTGATTDSLLVKAITAVITAYTDSTADKSKLVNALTAYISEYKNNPNVKKPTLEDLTQFIKDINTSGADNALAIWRAKQEATPISITPQITGTHQEGDTVYFEYEPVTTDKEGLYVLPPDEIDTTESVTVPVDANTSEAEQAVEEFKESIAETQIMPVTSDLDSSEVDNYSPPDKVQKVYQKVITPNADVGAPGGLGKIEATYFGESRAKGTLLGELGPEMVVSNGRYFVAGQNGPEMVDLADDAIIFNHLQTKSLLEKGTSSGRGRVVTSERNAISFAKGNINGGPAMASASAALAALKQLRAQWQALAGLSAKDLAGKGGGGGGGGGNDKQFVKDLEKWYNWLQKIAQLEKEISMEEAKRAKYQSDMVAHGREYAQSLLDTLPKLKEQAATNLALADAQQKYFDKRVQQMNAQSNPFTSLYTIDEKTGQLFYKNGALEKLSAISGRNDYGQANMSPEEQYNAIIAMNPAFAEFMKYDSSGQEIDQSDFVAMIQAFWDKIDSDKEEAQSLHDSIDEYNKAALEAEKQKNEYLREIEDNQIAVEEKVLKAIEDVRQRAIDDAKDEKDAIEKSSQAMIDGLSKQLQKERDMYQKQQDTDELTKLQRQLAILQRSGGSASQIADLERQISDKQQNAYFDAQQSQIDALQDATDRQIEKLDRQIQLMEDTLAYEKENGLLWGQVYDVMAGSPEEIAAFIFNNDSSLWGKSPLDTMQTQRETLFKTEQFTAYRDAIEGENGLVGFFKKYDDNAVKEEKEKIEAEAAQKQAEADAKTTVKSEPEKAVKPTQEQKKNPWEGALQYYATFNTPNGQKSVYGSSEANVKAQAAAAIEQAVKAKFGGWTESEQSGMISSMKNTISVKKRYDIGGMVDETGPALLHAKEGVLTPQQTSVLRNDIMGRSSNSLISLLMDFRDAYNNLPNASDYSTINTNNGITIENATVEMHVASIANDYDAKRAGEQALEKMLSIARKTSAQNRIG